MIRDSASRALNIGLLGGLARMEGDTLCLYQTRYAAMAYRMRLLPGARPAAYDYEPVLVAFRMRAEAEGQLGFEAIEVVRMPKDAFPRKRAGNWLRRKIYQQVVPDIEAAAEVVPYQPYLPGQIVNPEVESALADRAEWSPSLRRAMEEHDLVADVMDYSECSAGNFVGQWVGVGWLAGGVYRPGVMYDGGGQSKLNFLWCKFLPAGQASNAPMTMIVASAVPGCYPLRLDCEQGVQRDLAVFARLIHSPFEPEPGTFFRRTLNVLDVLTVAGEDYANPALDALAARVEEAA